MNILFDATARKAISNAINEARKQGHASYDTDDLLLGVALIEGPVAELLACFAVTPYEIRSRNASYRHIDEPQTQSGTLPTLHANTVLELAQEQSSKADDGAPISHHHLLQCIIHVMNAHPDSTAAKVCNNLNVDLDDLFDSLTTLIESQDNAAKLADKQAKQQEIRHLTEFNLVPVERFTATVLKVITDDQLSQILDLMKK